MKKKNLLLLNVIIAGFLFLGVLHVNAQTGSSSLEFSPSVLSAEKGEEIEVSIIVDSGGVPINSVNVRLSFPTGNLKLKQISPQVAGSSLSITDSNMGDFYVLPFDYRNFNTAMFPDRFTVATLRFEVIEEGEATVNFRFSPEGTAASGLGKKGAFPPENILASVGSFVLNANAEEAPNEKTESLEEFLLVIERLTNVVFWFIMALVILMFLVACYYLITSKGDPLKLNIAKRMFIYIAIGLLVALFAKAFPGVLRSLIE
ncbi:MAG: hypothetical protein ABIF89_02880, partial [bacterium]